MPVCTNTWDKAVSAAILPLPRGSIRVRLRCYAPDTTSIRDKPVQERRPIAPGAALLQVRIQSWQERPDQWLVPSERWILL
jgi:hypothetical protein